MPRQPINLEHKTFASKKDATEHFKNMLNRYNDGDIISSSEDELLLYDLLQRHPEVEEKVGVGIVCFYKDSSPDFPTSCFHIKRSDDTTTDFSYGTCIKSTSPSLFQEFYSACHNSIRPRIIAEKEALFSSNQIIECSITGEVITIDNSEYRHINPAFIEIVRSFIESEGIEISREMIEENQDMQYATVFANQELENRFKEYHLENANFEIVKKYERR